MVTGADGWDAGPAPSPFSAVTVKVYTVEGRRLSIVVLLTLPTDTGVCALPPT